ncbi:MAG TPA: AMP-binding protein [Chthoniobacteraceae bacterium]|jgi:phenylacetate-CoA ligase
MTALQRLQALLAAVSETNRFYAPRLSAAGITAEIPSLEEFSARLPFTTKAQLVEDQALQPPYGTNLTFPLESYTRFCQTTGTTGRPMIWLDTNESWEWLLGNWARIYHAAGVGAGDRAYFAFSFGPFLGFWTAYEAATKLGLLCLPGGGLSTAARLHAIVQHQATVLCCTPTYALHLLETARREQIDLGGAAVRKIIVAGEPGGSVAHVRERISEGWNGAEVFDHYGMTEVGPVAWQNSGEADVLRVIVESYFAEIIDPGTGTPVATGDPGELVLTTLGRTASPLLRYRTGDLVRRRKGTEGFALDGGIIGRVDDMIVVRGVNLYPSAVDAVVRSVPEISEYRVEVSRRGALAEVALQAESDIPSAAEELQRALTSAFSLRIPVTLAASGTLPRFEMKARRWIFHD